MLAGAWVAVLDIIEQVPRAFCEYLSATDDDDNEDNASRTVDPDEEIQRWSKASLACSFSCVELIVDEFLDLLSMDDVQSVISCLAVFSSQLQDVNISLTSLEMLWKVTDVSISSMNRKGDALGIESVLSIMLTNLQRLSMDSRPEVKTSY